MPKYRKKAINPTAIAGLERHLIEKHYGFLSCKVLKGTLYCDGQFQPTKESEVYSYRIKYKAPNRPVVTVTDPYIEYNDDIHMYPENRSLCLYHKTDLVWNTTHNLYDTIIPWTHEWFVFYELYKIHGEWLHPFVPHKPNSKI